MERRDFVRWSVAAGRFFRNRFRDLTDTTKCRRTVYSDLTKTRAETINRECPDAVCETVCVGRFGTPGAVKNDETLQSILISPTDFEKQGSLLGAPAIARTLLSHSEEKGMSVMRGVAPYAEIERVIKIRLRKPEQIFYGVAKFQTSEVRKLAAPETSEKRNFSDRFFMVLDTDMRDLPNHAEIYVTKPKSHPKISDKTIWRKERFDLLKIISSNVQLADDFRKETASSRST